MLDFSSEEKKELRKEKMKEFNIKFNNFRVCAGIVTFNSDIKRLRQNIVAIYKQVEVIIIVDNGSKNIYEIQQLIRGKDNIFLVKNIFNEGIAKALNQIFMFAESRDFNWIITLDQDSVCENNMIETFAKYISYPNVGVICPRIDYFNHKQKKDIKSNEIDYVQACMTSASLTSLLAWKKVGGFDEWMFIDYVDNDFGMRLKLHGYKIIRVNQTILHHILGRSEIKKIGIFKALVFNHTPFRNYYYVRNSIYFIKKYRKHINVLKYIAILVIWELKKLVLEKNRIQTAKSLIAGLKDGITAKYELAK